MSIHTSDQRHGKSLSAYGYKHDSHPQFYGIFHGILVCSAGKFGLPSIFTFCFMSLAHAGMPQRIFFARDCSLTSKFLSQNSIHACLVGFVLFCDSKLNRHCITVLMTIVLLFRRKSLIFSVHSPYFGHYLCSLSNGCDRSFEERQSTNPS